MSTREPSSIAKRFVVFCLSIFVGVILLQLALQLLAQFWGWLVLLIGISAAIWLASRFLASRRDRW